MFESAQLLEAPSEFMGAPASLTYAPTPAQWRYEDYTKVGLTAPPIGGGLGAKIAMGAFTLASTVITGGAASALAGIATGAGTGILGDILDTVSSLSETFGAAVDTLAPAFELISPFISKPPVVQQPRGGAGVFPMQLQAFPSGQRSGYVDLTSYADPLFSPGGGYVRRTRTSRYQPRWTAQDTRRIRAQIRKNPRLRTR